MALFLTFEGLKSLGIANAKPYGVCGNIHNYLRAEDYQMLIDAAIPEMVYLYRTGIVNDTLLSEVDETLLNQNGIYTTNATIDNPGLEIFVLKDAEVTVNITDGSRQNVNVMGTGIAHVSVYGNSWAAVKCYQSGVADITVNDTSAACIEAAQNSGATITLNDSASGDIIARGDSTITVTANGTSYARIQGFAHTVITTAGTGTINQTLYELSQNPTVAI